MANNKSLPIQLANKIVKLSTNYHHIDSVLGDLQEEFQERAKINLRSAYIWYWRQAFEVIISVEKHNSALAITLTQVSFLFLAVVFVFSFHLIGWLAYADEPATLSSGTWPRVLGGHVYLLFSESQFWQFAPVFWGKLDGVAFLLNFDSSLVCLLLVLAYCCSLGFKRRSFLFSFCAGACLLFLPAVLGILFLSQNTLLMHQVGPVLAIMIFPVVYLVLPLTMYLWIVSKKNFQSG